MEIDTLTQLGVGWMHRGSASTAARYLRQAVTLDGGYDACGVPQLEKAGPRPSQTERISVDSRRAAHASQRALTGKDQSSGTHTPHLPPLPLAGLPPPLPPPRQRQRFVHAAGASPYARTSPPNHAPSSSAASRRTTEERVELRLTLCAVLCQQSTQQQRGRMSCAEAALCREALAHAQQAAEMLMAAIDEEGGEGRSNACSNGGSQSARLPPIAAGGGGRVVCNGGRGDGGGGVRGSATARDWRGDKGDRRLALLAMAFHNACACHEYLGQWSRARLAAKRAEKAVHAAQLAPEDELRLRIQEGARRSNGTLESVGPRDTYPSGAAPAAAVELLVAQSIDRADEPEGAQRDENMHSTADTESAEPEGTPDVTDAALDGAESEPGVEPPGVDVDDAQRESNNVESYKYDVNKFADCTSCSEPS